MTLSQNFLQICLAFNLVVVLILLMSQQLEAHLSLPMSYDFNRDKLAQYRKSSIDSAKFHSWLQNDMYRSSYAHHHSPDSLSPKHSHIPGYSGFIPKDRAESLYGKTYSNKTKDALMDYNNQGNRNGLATTGFNITQDALIDKSKVASSHKYGKTQLQTPHPAWIPKNWVSTTKADFLNPDQNGNPLYRQTQKDLQTHKLKTKTSGFQQNRDYWDGKGWNPHPVLNPSNQTSEYRDRFNPELPFHRQVNKHALPQLERPQYVYKFNK